MSPKLLNEMFNIRVIKLFYKKLVKITKTNTIL